MKIIFFGDSNTWGYDWRTGERLCDRFTAQIALAKPQWTVIEEGLNGRQLYSRNPFVWDTGCHHIEGVLKRHHDADLIVIGLGANDARRMCATTMEEWTRHLDIFLDKLEESLAKYSRMQVLLVTPPMISDEAMRSENVRTVFGDSGRQILIEAQSEICAAAAKRGYWSLRCDAFGLYGCAEDGVHLEIESHTELARWLVQTIENIEQAH